MAPAPAPLTAKDVMQAINDGHLPPEALRRLRSRFPSAAEFAKALKASQRMALRQAVQGKPRLSYGRTFEHPATDPIESIRARPDYGVHASHAASPVKVKNDAPVQPRKLSPIDLLGQNDPLSKLITGLLKGAGNIGTKMSPKALQQLLAQSGQVGKSIDLGPVKQLLAQGGLVGKMIPSGYADSIAGMQFDPQIRAAQIQLLRQPRQAEQNLHDIAGFYNQVRQSLGKAAGADSAAAKAASASLGDAAANIVASLGGSANAGSAAVGAAGEDAAGTLAALGNAQDFYNAQLQPLLSAESASQRSSEMARQTALHQDLAAQLAGLQGARGQAKAAAMADILQANNALAQQRYGNRTNAAQTLASLLGQNNALAQQQFGNRAGVLQALQQLVGQNNQVAQAGFTNRASLLQTLAAIAASQQSAAQLARGRDLLDAKRQRDLSAPAPGTFAAASPASKARVTQNIFTALLDPNTGELKEGIDLNRALQIAQDIVRSNGWSAQNPNVRSAVIGPGLRLAGLTLQK